MNDNEKLEALRGKTVSLDFDATIHTYDRWTGLEPLGEPISGAVAFVEMLLDAGVRVVISTCRAAHEGGREAINTWLERHGFPVGIHVTCEKPQAVAYVDDRAVVFRGSWSDVLTDAAGLANKHAV